MEGIWTWGLLQIFLLGSSQKICIQTYTFKPVKNIFMDHPTVVGLYIPTHTVSHLTILNFGVFGIYASFPNSGIHLPKVCGGGEDAWHVVYLSRHFRRNCYSHLQDRRQRQQFFWNVSNDLPNCMLSHPKKENKNKKLKSSVPPMRTSNLKWNSWANTA
jgi:hypothetical protein